MQPDVPANYAGAPLSEALRSLLPILYRNSFYLVVTGHAGKTIRIERNGQNCGYINSTVIQRRGILGYHFAKHGSATDACPEELRSNLVPYFCERYGCSASALDVYIKSEGNSGRAYLILKDPQVALRILLRDLGIELDQDLHIVTIKERYIEGRLVDVVMQRRERSEAARSACLAFYGFTCYVCQVSLKQRYSGLPVEVIHVHHEEPLSQMQEEREFDPVATMKPVCPNCHCVIHSRTPPYSIEEVRGMLENET